MYDKIVNKYGKQVVYANISTLHDVLNRLILDIGIHYYSNSEIERAKTYVEALKKTEGGSPYADNVRQELRIALIHEFIGKIRCEIHYPSAQADRRNVRHFPR